MLQANRAASHVRLDPNAMHNLRMWDNEFVLSWLQQNGFDDFVQAFALCRLNGDHLFHMKASDLTRVGDFSIKRRKALVKAIARLVKQQAERQNEICKHKAARPLPATTAADRYEETVIGLPGANLAPVMHLGSADIGAESDDSWESWEDDQNDWDDITSPTIYGNADSVRVLNMPQTEQEKQEQQQPIYMNPAEEAIYQNDNRHFPIVPPRRMTHHVKSKSAFRPESPAYLEPKQLQLHMKEEPPVQQHGLRQNLETAAPPKTSPVRESLASSGNVKKLAEKLAHVRVANAPAQNVMRKKRMGAQRKTKSVVTEGSDVCSGYVETCAVDGHRTQSASAETLNFPYLKRQTPDQHRNGSNAHGGYVERPVHRNHQAQAHHQLHGASQIPSSGVCSSSSEISGQEKSHATYRDEESTHIAAGELFGHLLRRSSSETTNHETTESKLIKVARQLDSHLGMVSSSGDNLSKYSWYKARLDRGAAEEILKQEIHTGRFILRESQTSAGSYTLSVLVDDQVRHIRVRETSQGFCLRENATEKEMFPTVLHLVKTYCNTKLQLRGSIPFYLLPGRIENMSEA